MKVLDNLRETLGYGGVKLPPLQEVKPQHRLGKFGDYENALDDLCINALENLTPEQREIIFRRCSRKIRSYSKMKHLWAVFGVGGFHRFYIKDYVGGAAMLLTGGLLICTGPRKSLKNTIQTLLFKRWTTKVISKN